jgi:dihydromethanopterin reductase (acceptor)
MKQVHEQRTAWAITGSGHYLRESLDIMAGLADVDLFLSKAADEILRQYGYTHQAGRVFLDKTSSSVPIELLYHGQYHTVVIAPATSNTIAKMVAGISDSLVTNLYAQAGKCRVHSIVFACDTAPELKSLAPNDHWVKVYPRQIDLENVKRLQTFEVTEVVENMQALSIALSKRPCLKKSSF